MKRVLSVFLLLFFAGYFLVKTPKPPQSTKIVVRESISPIVKSQVASAVNLENKVKESKGLAINKKTGPHELVDDIFSNYKDFCSDLDNIRFRLKSSDKEYKQLMSQLAVHSTPELMERTNRLSQEVSKFRGSLILCLNDNINENKEKERDVSE